MNALPPAEGSASAFSPEPAAEIVELSLLNGVDYHGLTNLFVALWQEERFRVALDCSQLDSLGMNEVRTLIRFADQFAHHGGLVRLVNANRRIRSLLEVLHCAELLVPCGRADSLVLRRTRTVSVPWCSTRCSRRAAQEAARCCSEPSW
jgi:hypothetical protein